MLFSPKKSVYSEGINKAQQQMINETSIISDNLNLLSKVFTKYKSAKILHFPIYLS